MLKAIIRASHKSLSRLFNFCSENGKNHPVANQKLSKCFRSKCASEAGAGNDHLRFPVGVRSVAEIHKENLNRSSLMTYTFIDELCFSRMKLMRLLPVRLSQQPPQAYLHRAFPLFKTSRSSLLGDSFRWFPTNPERRLSFFSRPLVLLTVWSRSQAWWIYSRDELLSHFENEHKLRFTQGWERLSESLVSI